MSRSTRALAGSARVRRRTAAVATGGGSGTGGTGDAGRVAVGGARARGLEGAGCCGRDIGGNLDALLITNIRKSRERIRSRVTAELGNLARRVLGFADGGDVGGVLVRVYGAEEAAGWGGGGCERGEGREGEEDGGLGEHGEVVGLGVGG